MSFTRSTRFTRTKIPCVQEYGEGLRLQILALLEPKYLLTGTKVQNLTPAEQEYGEGLRLQILEFRFAAEVRMREDYDKAKDIKFFPAIGDDPTTEEELELVALRRDARRRAREMEVLTLLALLVQKCKA